MHFGVAELAIGGLRLFLRFFCSHNPHVGGDVEPHLLLLPLALLHALDRCEVEGVRGPPDGLSTHAGPNHHEYF